MRSQQFGLKWTKMIDEEKSLVRLSQTQLLNFSPLINTDSEATRHLFYSVNQSIKRYKAVLYIESEFLHHLKTFWSEIYVFGV